MSIEGRTDGKTLGLGLGLDLRAQRAKATYLADDEESMKRSRREKSVGRPWSWCSRNGRSLGRTRPEHGE